MTPTGVRQHVRQAGGSYTQFDIEFNSGQIRVRKKNDLKEPFKCDGCHEPGIGIGYEAIGNGFKFHVECAVRRKPGEDGTPKLPPCFGGKKQFRFETSPGSTGRDCYLCAREIKGWHYRSSDASGHLLHPHCADLSLTGSFNRFGDAAKQYFGNSVLKLCKPDSGTDCWKCRESKKSWFYKDSNGCQLHLSCLTELLTIEQPQELEGNRRANGGGSSSGGHMTEKRVTTSVGNGPEFCVKLKALFKKVATPENLAKFLTAVLSIAFLGQPVTSAIVLGAYSVVWLISQIPG